jgi:hypothetical protein
MSIRSLNSVATPGTIIISLDDDCPSGYFKLDGSTGNLNKTDFPMLWDNLKHLSIMTPYAATSFFVLPNFSGRFLRQSGLITVKNWSGGSYTGTTTRNYIPVGTVQEDAIRNITGSMDQVSEDWNNYGVGYGVFWKEQGFRSGFTPSRVDWSPAGRAGFNANRVVPTDIENRPLSIAVNYFIKY